MTDEPITAETTKPMLSGAALVSETLLVAEGEGLHRRLGQRQLTMMAIGGAIGVGLFLGSGVTIRLAGPAVILSYLLGAGIALIMSYVLAEMAVVHPVAGAFGVCAEKYLNPWAGFSVRATYGAAQIIAIGAEVTAAGIYISFWLPNVPQWIWVVLVSAALVALNSMQVNRLGEFEYWFAMIKVAAIIAFILVGLSLIFGIGSQNPIGLANLTRHGGFLPTGFKGVWLSLTLTVTSYMGVEIIAVTAGEGRASGNYHPTRHAKHCLPAHFVLCAGNCDHGDYGSLEPTRQFACAFRQSFCDRVRGGAYTLCRRDYELRRAHGRALEREHEPLSFNSDAFLSGPGRLCPQMDGQGEPQWSAASRPAGFNRRDYRSHSARGLCP